MPTLLERLEYAIGYALYPFRARDDQLFIQHLPEASRTLEVISPECGPSNSYLTVKHTPFGEDAFPALEWSRTSDATGTVKEWLVLSEDPDAPLLSPIVHGIFYNIPAETTSLNPQDFRPISGTESRKLTGGFCYGVNRKGTVYMGARPPAGHGAHRYFFVVVGLSETLRVGSRIEDKLTKEELIERISGLVITWGSWIGMYERKVF